MIAPGIRFVQDYGNADVVVLMIASAALFLLVVGRMAGLVRQEERAASRELALRNAGGQLVAAAGQEQIHDAAISAVHRLLGAEAGVRLALRLGHRTDGRGGDRRWRGSPAARLHVGMARRDRVPAADPPDRGSTGGVRRASASAGRLPARAAALDAGRGPRPPRDLLAVAAASPELLDSLEGLATQISLALEAASLTEDLHRRQSEARFRSLVAHSSDLITVLDGDGIVTYQSPSIERVLGYSVDEIEGTQFDRLLLDTDRTGPLPGDHGRRSRGLRGARDRAARCSIATVRGSSSRSSTRTCSPTSTCAESS